MQTPRRILGVVGSDRKGGVIDTVVSEIADSAAVIETVKVRLVSTQDFEV